MRRPSVGESPPAIAKRASTASFPFQFRISALPPFNKCVWTPERKLAQPCRAAARCPVTQHGMIQFSCSILVSSGIHILECLTKNIVIVRPGIWSSISNKRSMRNYSWSAISTSRELSPWLVFKRISVHLNHHYKEISVSQNYNMLLILLFKTEMYGMHLQNTNYDEIIQGWYFEIISNASNLSKEIKSSTSYYPDYMKGWKPLGLDIIHNAIFNIIDLTTEGLDNFCHK